MDKIPLNFSILANPWNWLVVLLMVYIVGLAFAAIFGTSAADKFTPIKPGGSY